MKVVVRLFGTLAARFPEYDPTGGMVVELPRGAKVSNLLDRLGISGEESGAVAVGGKVAGRDETLTEGASVNILQKMHGG